MQSINAGGPPSMPPGSHLRFRSRKNKGFFSRMSAQGPGFMLNIGLSMLGLFLVFGYLIWRFFLSGSSASAQELPATAPPPQTVIVATVPPLETPATPAPAAINAGTFNSPLSPLEPAQIAATATFVAAINRPAAFNAPEAAPFFIGVVTYESGCNVSNLGFTTAGLNGSPYYLYFSQPLERDPLMQMINVSGYIQEFDTCQYPIIMVQQIYWLDGQATPAPLAIGGAYSSTTTISGSTISKNTWGVAAVLPTPTPDVLITRPELLQPQQQSETATPYPTYTPYPTTVPWVPPHTPVPPPPAATKTPKPTSTPTHTPSPTPTQQANVSGPVISIAGCAATNLAIQTGQDSNVRLILNGATLPPNGNPVGYNAVATGYLSTVCNGQAIYASSISWYLPTVTPTTEPATATPTTEPATPTPTGQPPTATATSPPPDPDPTATPGDTGPGRP